LARDLPDPGAFRTQNARCLASSCEIMSGTMFDPYPVAPAAGGLQATIVPPGSKSITNRALLCAALAEGASILRGALIADDTDAMLGCVRSLGVAVRVGDAVGKDTGANPIEIDGCSGRPPFDNAHFDARQSGTTARFLLPVLTLGHGRARLDALAQLRARPMAPLVDALNSLGASLTSTDGTLPIISNGGGLRGGHVRLAGDVSSQFLSGLLLTAPSTTEGITIELTTELVSRPYVDMTIAVMAAFGVDVEQPDEHRFVVAPQRYRARAYDIEPDASAASYPLAAAAMCGGSVTVNGLGTDSIQGDVAFIDVLEAMGAHVHRSAKSITVTGVGPLRGVDVDLSAISDTAPTFAVAAALATSRSRARGIGFIRRKESDRIGAVVTELRRCGMQATAEADGFTINPLTVRGDLPQLLPTVIQTYEDHRIAMSFALLGLAGRPVSIADPGCVAKTYPQYWEMLDYLRSTGTRAEVPPAPLPPADPGL
jgi:3-phosphoshikimate 1-carboxyvinyltransferase